MTREECLNALKDIIARGGNQEELFYWACGFQKEIKLLTDLIEEHFSNPPLTFGELKVGMWIWDNKLKEWRKVIEKLIVGVSEGSEFYEDIYVKGTKVIRIGLHKFDWKDILFESKRFYRKEVQE